MKPRLCALARVIGGLSLAGCASSGGANLSTVPPSPDPRVGLRAGAVRLDSANHRVLEVTPAAQAAWNLRLITNRPSSEKFVGVTNSDLAFFRNYVIQGNYNGFQVWDIANPAAPVLKVGYLCPASQSDVSVYKNLLFVSGEGMGGRLDCGTQGVHDSVSTVRLRGLRIFDISDIANPRYIANVQTCRGSHTHSVVIDPNDTANVYVYISGAAPVRSPTELPGCVAASPDSSPNSARRIPHLRMSATDQGRRRRPDGHAMRGRGGAPPNNCKIPRRECLGTFGRFHDGSGGPATPTLCFLTGLLEQLFQRQAQRT